MADIDYLWDEDPIDVTNEANLIWSVANNLRGAYLPSNYGEVIIPMTILRRFECVLSKTKNEVVEKYEANNNIAPQALEKITGYEFYNTSRFTLKELCNDTDQNLVEDLNSYIDGFSENVQEIFKELGFKDHITKMEKKGCLLQVLKKFSEIDLSVETYDSIKMGYIFENLIGRFYQSVDAGQYYTGRDIIKLMVSLLISEGCDDIFQENKVITICDQACGTGGMLATAYTYLKHYNPSCHVELFGQEVMPTTYAVGLAEMLIKRQKSTNFKNADTLIEDCFPMKKMRFVLENPPFGQAWKGEDSIDKKEENAVKDEYKKGKNGRWGAGLPAGGDAQLLFMQSAIDKMDDNLGRAAIIQDGSSLFKGDISSGESQIRRSMLKNDLIEAIIALPSDSFYNTGIGTYIWILSKNKRAERKGKVQLIDATTMFHKLRKPAGKKKNEISPDDRKKIVELYTKFEENENSKIFDNDDFLYKEYITRQPLQRSYAITRERINNLKYGGILSNYYDEETMQEMMDRNGMLTISEEKKCNTYKKNEAEYKTIIAKLNENIDDKKYLQKKEFSQVINKILPNIDKAIRDKVIMGLSLIDKDAVVERDKKGNVLYDKETEDIEIVSYKENIETYMQKEVLPYVPDAKAFYEGEDKDDIEDVGLKKKIGAEIPFNRIFYKHQELEKSDRLLEKFKKLNASTDKKIKKIIE